MMRRLHLRLRNLSLFRISIAFVCLLTAESNAADSTPDRTAIVRAVDLDVHEAQEVTLSDKTRVRVKLLSVDETRDVMRDAVRQARVHVELNGRGLVLISATYHLPVKFAGVQVDCPITKGHVGNSSQGNAWGLLKDARLRRYYRLTQDRGVLVLGVESGSPAQRAGLCEGDLIIGFKRQPVAGIDELLRKLVGAEIGIASVLTVLRQTDKLDLHITPKELPLRGESWMNNRE